MHECRVKLADRFDEQHLLEVDGQGPSDRGAQLLPAGENSGLLPWWVYSIFTSMRMADITARLADLGGEKWAVHALARQLQQAGRPIIEMTIGEPDVSVSPALLEVATAALHRGRTAYSDGRGEPALCRALAARYSRALGRQIASDQILCFPGTQTSLYAVLMGVAEAGDEVLVGDPMYATYAGLVAATGATMVPVPLAAADGFRMNAAALAPHITPASRAILINNPHNPTGAVLSADDVAGIGELAVAHDLWLIVDEVYEELVFEHARFVSPLRDPRLAERVIVASSISKSHAAPGFRSGWCVASAAFTKQLLPLSETMLFGNQPFIADMTAHAVVEPSAVAVDMRQRFARRADLIFDALDGVAGLSVNRPGGGMFVLVNVADVAAPASSIDSQAVDVSSEARALSASAAMAKASHAKAIAIDLLMTKGVAVMPGCSFGNTLTSWVRLAVTIDDEMIAEACKRIVTYARERPRSQQSG